MVRGLRRDTAAYDGDTRDCRGEGRRGVTYSGLPQRPVNYLGLCALAQPAGLVGELPVGVQIIGKPWAERTVLALGEAFEAATPFHALRPKLSSLGLA
jgi:Asp-tRNA(Asn)/Glu-tRNA(Gln) amidotransferase A subunit family amidase